MLLTFSIILKHLGDFLSKPFLHVLIKAVLQKPFVLNFLEICSASAATF